MADTITIRTLGPDDAHVLERVRDGVFDNPIEPSMAWAFLAVRLNLITVALLDGEVVGFVSGTVLLHPDKPRQLFVNEVSVHEDVRREGVGARMIRSITNEARERGCEEAWVLTDTDNEAACALYESLKGEASSDHVMFTWDLTDS